MLAIAPAVLVSSIPSWLLNWPWALEPVTERVMQLTPVDLAQQLILRLGTTARPLAVLGGFSICLLLGGFAGLLVAMLSRRVSVLISLPAGALALLIAIDLLFPPRQFAPIVILVIAFALFLAPTSRIWRGRPAAHNAVPSAAGPGRGTFLIDSLRIVGCAALLSAAIVAEPWYKSLTVYRRGGALFAFRPRGARRAGFTLPGLTPEISSAQSFYYLSKNLVDPDLTAEAWNLKVTGLVRRATHYSFDALLALPSKSQYVTLECVSNPVGGPLIGCALFTGVSLRQLLAAAGPLSEATTVVMRAPDGHADSIPLALALDPAVLVAYGMNGAYLDRGHGYPARMLIPGSYGFKGVKWVEQIELVAHDFKGTWQELGWTQRAVVHTMARIDLARHAAGGALVAGVAFAGKRGIRAVQVRANGGPWIDAALHTPPLSDLTWVQWRAIVPARGRVMFEARAMDGAGSIQDERNSDIYPAGATGYHQVTADV